MLNFKFLTLPEMNSSKSKKNSNYYFISKNKIFNKIDMLHENYY